MSGHPIFARLYRRFAPMGPGVGAHGDEVLSTAAGRVLEVGASSGLCFSHCSEDVSEVVGAKPEPYPRGLAERTAPSQAQ